MTAERRRACSRGTSGGQAGEPVDDVEIVLPVEARSVGAARNAGRSTCVLWRLGEVADDVALVVSELAGNAVRHGATGQLVLRLRLSPRRLRVELVDNSPGTPAVREHDELAESGRGMFLVSAVSLRWGVAREGRGKCTWAELAVPAC